MCVVFLRPVRCYFASCTFHIGAEVVPDLAQDEVDVLLHGHGVGRHVGGRVRRPGDSHFLPGQEEDDTPVAGGGIQKTHVVRAERCSQQNSTFYLKLNLIKLKKTF